MLNHGWKTFEEEKYQRDRTKRRRCEKPESGFQDGEYMNMARVTFRRHRYKQGHQTTQSDWEYYECYYKIKFGY